MNYFTHHFGLYLIGLFVCLIGQVEATSGWNAKDFGAKGDGIADDGKAIQNALTAAKEAGGGEVYLPAGTYRIEDHLSVPSGVTLRGSWQAPHHEDIAWGTVLHAVGHRGEENGPPLIQLQPSAAVCGLTIYYPDQIFPDIQPYPWAIQGRGMHGSVMDITFVNAYQGIDFGSHHNELHYIRNVFGVVLRRGIYINNCTDIGRIENVHFNPHYWARANLPAEKRIRRMNDLINYLNANTEVFIFGRTDWEYVLNTFAFGFDKCYKFIKTPEGACNGNFLGIGADGGHYGLWVEATQPPGLLITNGEFVTFAGEKPTEIVTTEEFKGVVQLANCSFWGPAHRNALIQGDGYVSFQQCNFVHWGKDDPTAHALRIEGGEVNISGCRFTERKPAVFLGEKVKTGIIMGNHFNSEIQIENHSRGDIQIGLNAARAAK
ncbi:MAG: hypothetical protein C4527_16290 [Candidatus Omnitrophota bacterium]|jgi:hypothetical protein|nr:MAG: hypothetical protein C4527_16290 [Candidatus Omnitrophota bacterium]